MKAYTKIFGAVLTMAVLLYSCKPDSVRPKGDEPLGGPTLGLASNDTHALYTPFCSEFDTLPLLSELGSSLTVNFNCVSNCPQWGYVSTYNSDNYFVAKFRLAQNWFVDFANSDFSIASAFSFTPNGIPVTANDWLAYNPNPDLNSWQMVVPLDSIGRGPDNCFLWAARLSVWTRSFFGGFNPASRRTLWVRNGNWNVAGHEDNSPSQFLTPHCWIFCPVEPDTICTDLTPTNSCRTLSPDLTGLTNSAVTYAWSTGATTSSISACPSANVSYYTVTVTETPGRAPVGVFTYCMPVLAAPDTVCASFITGLPSNSGPNCTTISAPNTSNIHNGPVQYQWSTGATTSSIQVCGTVASSYMVTITQSPSGQPVATYYIQMASNNVQCYAGNSPHHKVKVCHRPPGNPSNVQNICIDWSGVPAHVERFRSPNFNPRQGHDSGCEIGECGYNPCD